MKICSRCKKRKNLEDFFRCKSGKYGRHNQCKECSIINQRNCRARNQDKYKETNRKWSKSFKARAWLKAHSKRGADRYNFGGNRELAIQRDNNRCVSCSLTREEHRNKWGRDITVDHINGRINNELSNLQTLCLTCHGKKDTRRGKILSWPQDNYPRYCEYCKKQILRTYNVPIKYWVTVHFCNRGCRSLSRG